MSATTIVHTAPCLKGRWGYHACSYTLYRKLKRLTFLLFLGRRRQAAWQRWNRKAPHNRVLRVRAGNAPGNRGPEVERRPLAEPVRAPAFAPSWETALHNYRAARTPWPSAGLVPPLSVTEAEVDLGLATLQPWWLEHCSDRARRATPTVPD